MVYCVMDRRGWYYDFVEYIWVAVTNRNCYTTDHALALGIADAYNAIVINA